MWFVVIVCTLAFIVYVAYGIYLWGRWDTIEKGLPVFLGKVPLKEKEALKRANKGVK